MTPTEGAKTYEEKLMEAMKVHTAKIIRTGPEGCRKYIASFEIEIPEPQASQSGQDREGMRWVQSKDRLPEKDKYVLFDFRENPPMYGKVEVYPGGTFITTMDSSGEEESDHLDMDSQWLDETPTSESRWPTDKMEFLFEFSSMSQWVNKAVSWFKKYSLDPKICLDTQGNVLHTGEDFQLAEDHGLYPVKVYKLKRTKDWLSKSI